MGRYGLILTLALVLNACGKNYGTPAPSSGPAFFVAGRIDQRLCGEDVCVSQAFTNAGNEAGGGECRLFKRTCWDSLRPPSITGYAAMATGNPPGGEAGRRKSHPRLTRRPSWNRWIRSFPPTKADPRTTAVHPYSL